MGLENRLITHTIDYLHEKLQFATCDEAGGFHNLDTIRVRKFIRKWSTLGRARARA